MILKINDRFRNRQLDYFNNFSLNLKFDSIGGTFGFSYDFNPDNREHKELSCIGHYHECSVEHNGELLLTGIVLSINMTSAPVKKLVAIGGYSLPGVLEDCEIPTTSYPLQSDGLTLKQIAQKLLQPFGIKMIIDNAVAQKMNSVFDKSTAGESQTVKAYLTELATQKNIVISHNEKGELLFTAAKTDQTPVMQFDFSNGVLPGVSMNLQFNGQAFHSHITVQKQAGIDADAETGNAGEATVRNPYVYPKAVYRPKVISQSSGSDVDTETAAKNALAAELKNIKLTIKLDRWLDANGKIIKPNNYITVLNPEVYLYNKTVWFIEEVAFSGNEKEQTAVLTCVLPEVYNGKTPVYLFKGINEHGEKIPTA